MPKSTYYDKYDPNGSLTKPDILEDSSNDSENKIFNPYTYQIAEKIKDLKEQLEKQYNQLTVVEYNHKRAIFEYLTLLNSNNRRKRVEISLEVTQKIYINGGIWKARKL
ncbi:13796_t:CDS:2 [Funneliformis geosporum]|nr:13796_t:CDS:2 [Funneliformis geosporum]